MSAVKSSSRPGVSKVRKEGRKDLRGPTPAAPRGAEGGADVTNETQASPCAGPFQAEAGA